MPLNNEVGSFYFIQYGSKFALGFEGTVDFIERCYNLFYNFSATNGKLYKLHDGLGYIVVRSKEKIQKALEGYFYSEFLTSFKTKEEFSEDTGFVIEYDEKGCEAKAKIEAEQFMSKVQFKNFEAFKRSGEIYTVSGRLQKGILTPNI